MARFYLIGFLVLVVFDTVAQIGFKFAATSTAPAAFDVAWIARVVCEKWSYLSLLGYVGAFITWMTLLKHAPVGPAFAASHLEIVTVMIVSVLWLGESLSAVQLLGSVLIIAGIVVFALAESEISAEQEPDRCEADAAAFEESRC